jgi:Cu/Ag efflux pump CusA
MGIGIILLNALGYNLNQLSIVGFVLALGLLVDDSIVVVENIERWVREGHPLKSHCPSNQSDWISSNRMHRNLDNRFFTVSFYAGSIG